MALEPVDPYRSLLYDAGYGLCDECAPRAEARTETPQADVDDMMAILGEYYEPADAAQVAEELNRLFRSYRTEVKIGRNHYSPSPTWRDEYLLDYAVESPTRFAVRLHLFERTAAGGALEKSVGKYLGFVALRPPDRKRRESRTEDEDEGYHHVIEAEVTTPPHMLRPRYHLITTNASSARLGVMPFRSAVFMAPRFGDIKRKSTCVHLALSQALHLVMGRFGCKPVSQREFDWQLAKIGDAHSASKGVRIDQALEVLRCQCDSGGYIAHFVEGAGRDEQTIKMEALRCLTDTLANGMPVIMMVSEDLAPVHPSSLDHSGPAQDGQAAGDESRGPAAHAALILGMHLLHSRHEIPRHAPLGAGFAQALGDHFVREDHAELPGRLVGHDVLQGPFSEWTADALLSSALRVRADMDNGPVFGVHFLAVGPKGLRMGLNKASEAARGFVENHASIGGRLTRALEKYCLEHNCNFAEELTPELGDFDGWRFVVRLMSEREARDRYYGKSECRPKAGAALSPGYYWGVELWHPSAQRDEALPHPATILPALVILWDASLEVASSVAFPPPSAILLWDRGLMAEWVVRSIDTQELSNA